jgi:hypothetical protein
VIRALGALAVCACLGCDAGTSRGRDEPPDGIVWLAHRYRVDVTLLSSSCSPGGLSAEAFPATADVYQSGAQIEWAQRSDAPDAETWYLNGTLCASEQGAVMRLSGGRRDTVNGCQVVTDVPPFSDEALVDDCDPSGQATLTVDECGRVTGEIEAELRFGLECAFRSACRLRMRLDARPLTLDPRAPAWPDSCR